MFFGMLLALTMLAAQQPHRDSLGYWQQRVAYDITASLDEPTGVLSGSERIVYVNNSPDTLHTFSLHLYLNAFRPGSRWAAADSIEGRRRFNDLEDPDFAFNHARNVRIMGQAVVAAYPFAPDSTIARFSLPRALMPGDSLIVEMDWDARPSTLPRRQGREGRRFDFAQWYPKVVVYDRYGWNEHPVYPAGEFYGEFGRYLVRLDVAEDQVVGATGVPLCGDPGWARAAGAPGPIDYRRAYYPRAPELVGDEDCEPRGPGRKTIMWYAEDVHHFAMSLNPDFRYEEGHLGDVVVHVLYQARDQAAWGNGAAVHRTVTALTWLGDLFGPYAWPQLTNVDRIEPGGGTEFPMLIMDDSPDQGLIVHEAGHQYLMGMLANNEWREAWLDEGFTNFQTAWFFEARGRQGGYQRTEALILGLDLDGYSEPTSLISEDYRDFYTYNRMVYTRGELFFSQLRYIVGDENMRRILRTYYRQWWFKHVDELAFRQVAEEVSQQDLSTFFGQWLHGTALYDYKVGAVKAVKADRANGANGAVESGWMTRVEIVREAPGMIPVEVAVIAQGDTAVVRTDGLAEREWVEVVTRTKPKEVLLDPAVRTHDWNLLNNRKHVGLGLFDAKRSVYFDTYFSTPVYRDRLAVGVMPTVWYNDVAGVTLGVRSRSNYLGRYDENLLMVSRSTGWGTGGADPNDWDVMGRIKNPTWLRSPRLSESFEFLSLEGRLGLGVELEKQARGHLTYGPRITYGASLAWLVTTDTTYLDPGLYQDAGTVEGRVFATTNERRGGWLLAGAASVGGGLQYSNPGASTTSTTRYDVAGYFRGTITGTAGRDLAHGLGVTFRAFAGVALADGGVVRQRRIYLAGADPYQEISNPFLRSQGALLVRPGVFYQAPGGASIRGLDPHASATQAYAVSGELTQTILTRPGRGLFNRVALAAFGDVALANGDANPGGSGLGLVGDAGVGVRANQRIGETEFMVRVDLPLYVSDPALAQDQPAGNHSLGVRWLFSFEEAW